jgi:hypothetical protein
LIGIVGERIQILAFDHDRAGVVVGAGVEARTLFGDGDLLLVYGDAEREILQCGMPRLNRYRLGLREGKALGAVTVMV